MKILQGTAFASVADWTVEARWCVYLRVSIVSYAQWIEATRQLKGFAQKLSNVPAIRFP